MPTEIGTTKQTEEALKDECPQTARQRVRGWAKAHRKGLAAAGVCIAVTAIAAVGFGKLGVSGAIRRLPHQRPAVDSKVATQGVSAVALRNSASTRAPHGVSAHVRNLPAGRSASTAKLAEAAAKGIDLKPSQTLVAAYSTGTRAA